MNKAQAINSFWSGFGIPAYDENTVPIGAELPYITYEYIDSDDTAYMTASLWFGGMSWAEITEKTDFIGAVLANGGVMKHYDGGCAWIRKGTPFAQRMASDSGDHIRRVTLNISVDYINP